MLCICHSPLEDVVYTGAQSGEIYVWQGSTYRKAIPAHKGPVYAMFALLQSEEKVAFLSNYMRNNINILYNEKR